MAGYQLPCSAATSIHVHRESHQSAAAEHFEEVVADEMVASWPTLSRIWMKKIQKVLRGADRWSGVVESPAEVILRTCTTENIHCAELPGTGPSVGAERGGGDVESDNERPVVRIVAEIARERSRGGHSQGGASATGVGRSGL